MGTVRKIHIFIDSIGWSPDPNAKCEDMMVVDNVFELPPPNHNVHISVPLITGVGNIDLIRDRLSEIRYWMEK